MIKKKHKKSLAEYYDEQFYLNQIDGSDRSSKIVLGFLYNFYIPHSVIDFGCGYGAWLATAESLGSRRLKGLDGDWIDTAKLYSQNIDFTSIDFSEDFISMNEKYDLCISLEVAEHLPESKAQSFVNLLCSLSDVILFGAAVKYQEGINHINLQWQSYWIDLFESMDFQCFDIIRPNLWKNEQVKWFYRQNTFLFVRKSSEIHIFDKLKESENKIYDVIHPEIYKHLVKTRELVKNPDLQFCLRCFKRYLFNKHYFGKKGKK